LCSKETLFHQIAFSSKINSLMTLAIRVSLFQDEMKHFSVLAANHPAPLGMTIWLDGGDAARAGRSRLSGVNSPDQTAWILCPGVLHLAQDSAPSG
jgi:hypothetical protein